MEEHKEEVDKFSIKDQEYLYQRREIFDNLEKVKYQNYKITTKDQEANNLFKLKIKPSFSFPEDFYYYLSIKYKKEIEMHTFFEDLKKMPKGSLLHHHFCDAIDAEWISKEIMKPENIDNIYISKMYNKFDILLYTKNPKEGFIKFKPVIEEHISKKLNENLSKEKIVFDFFEEKLSLLPCQIEKAETNDDLWALFMPKYFYCYFIIKTEKFFRQHLQNLFHQCHFDGLDRIETRYNFGPIKDDNDKEISNDGQMEIIKEELEKFRKEINNENFSIGLIVEMIRKWNDEKVISMINEGKRLQKLYPELICGIDLSGDENNFRKIFELRKAIFANDDFDKGLPWIFHSGETLFKENYNIIDAILNHSKRLGHGINLIKHLPLLEMVKRKGIVIEVNPISNQTLRQTRDLRLHPGIGYHSYGIKIVLSNDDPTLYYTKGVNYDFFVSSVAMEFDLIDLKIIAMNSIVGSEMNKELKEKVMEGFEKKWEEFDEYIINKYKEK